MDNTKSPKGSTKIVKHEKQVLHDPHCHSVDKDKQLFKVEKNEFPSLSKVDEKNPKPEKDSSAYEVSSLTYSSKVKTSPVKCSSQSSKFENMQHSERPSKNESPLNKAGNGKHLEKPLSAVNSNRQSFTKQSSSTVYNVKPSSSKNSTDSKLNSRFSEVKNKKECFNERTNIKISYGQKPMNDYRYSKTTHGESRTFEKNGHSPIKGNNPKNSTSANVQKPLISKSLSNPKKASTGYSAVSRSERFYNKESNRPNINAQYKRHVEANRPVSSMGGVSQSVRLLQLNIMPGNVSVNTSNKARIASSLGSQKAYNSVKSENNKAGNQSLVEQSSLAGTSETKKKKNRKSKLKRQTALQTGKILVLTPEVHFKIVSQSNNVYVQKHRNVLTNINDSEEYPELGAAEPKTIKESHDAKGENSTNLNVFGSETDSKKNLLVSKGSSANDNLEAKSEEKSNAIVEKPEGEKSTIHSNNPITLSLFDMLVTAKPRKKEPEKKDEPADENNSKGFKKDMIKKNVSQAVNSLASSKPTIKRGKEREKPKVKRPSRMRKLILMERQLRKENIAMKRLEAEGENQEKSEEIFPRIVPINEFSVHDNLETCVEILQNYLANPESSNEGFDISDDLNNRISEQLALDSEDADPQSTPKSQTNISENSKLINEITSKANHSVENDMANIGSNENQFRSVRNSILDIEKDFVSNPASGLTDKEDNFVEDLIDINTVENFGEICTSGIRNLSEKHLDLKNKISDICCIDGNFMENLEKTENDCQTCNIINKIQESEHKSADMIENVIPAIVDSDVNTNIDFNTGNKSDSTEANKSNGNLVPSEKIISNISANSFSDKERLKSTKLMLHSRKFRQYCNHFISKEIDQAVFSLIDDLARFQDRMYQKDPVKAKIRRRLVYGIKEIKKHMKLKKVKCIIIATDIEDIKIEGGLNDSLRELISLAEAYQIPCVFSHWRFNLGKVCRKSVPVSCVGIFNYEGSEKNFKKMIELHDDSKYDYLEVTKKLASELTNDQVQELFEAEKESILFLREVSQRILKEMVYFTPEGYRNNKTSELLEKSTNIESEDATVVTTQQSESSNLIMIDEKSLSFMEEHSEMLKKLDKDENLSQLNETDINAILVKYKVVKEC